jgi:prolyl-tRNA synthetase
MIHGDSLGLVLPPRVAQTQVVFVPIPYNNGPDTAGKCQELAETLKTVEFGGDFLRVKVDDSKNHNPGAKFAHYELKGVPIRLECGPKDIDAGQVVAVCRHDLKKKIPIKFEDLAAELPKLLANMHEEMFQKAVKKRNESIVKVTKWEEVRGDDIFRILSQYSL